MSPHVKALHCDSGRAPRRDLVLLAVLLFTVQVFAGEVEYRTGGPRFAKTWQTFYVEADHEPELDDPLIKAGRDMTAAICKAIVHPDMKRRRYAIGALGFIGDRNALSTLEAILKNKKETYYFRGDALHSIYQIDRELGSKYARLFGNDHDYLRMLAGAIQRKEAWLTEPTEE